MMKLIKNLLKVIKNNELKTEIEKLTKSNIKFSGLPTLFQDIGKKTIRLKLLLQLILIKKFMEKMNT